MFGCKSKKKNTIEGRTHYFIEFWKRGSTIKKKNFTLTS